MRLTVLAGLALALTLACVGCNGPKGDCEGTLNSFKGCVNSNDWECVTNLMVPAQRKKYTDKGIGEWAESMYKGAKHFKWTGMNAVTTGKQCIAQTECAYTIKIRGKQPFDLDEYYSYILHEGADGKWYMEVPGTSKLGGF